MKRICLCLIALLSICSVSVYAEVPEKPSFTGYVYDYANVISATDEYLLDAYAQSVDSNKVAQVIAVTVDSLSGTDIAEYCLEVFNSWGIGHVDENDGVLILLAPNERNIYVMTGSGIDKQITEDEIGYLIDQYAIPAMISGDYSGGMRSLTKAVCLKATLERSPLFDDRDMILNLL